MEKTTPKRHQMPPRHLRKGWRKPENSKVVTRASRWGNPYKTIEDGGTYTREESLAHYRRDLFSDEGVQARPDLPRITLKDAMDNLRGYDLVCGCDLDQPCHADLLLSVCNIPWGDAPEPTEPVSQENADLIAACFTEDKNWGQGYYDYVEALNEREPMDPKDYHLRLGMATFCGVNGLIPGFDNKVNWFGFGDLPIAFEDQNDDPLKTMFWVNDFAKVSGIDPDKLTEWWKTERDEDDRSDVYGLSYYCPERNSHWVQPLLGHSAAMRAMTFLSPWQREFYEQTKEMMSHALMKSGLGKTLLGGGTGYTAIAHMRDDKDDVIRVSMPIKSFREGDNVPLVTAPFDDASEDETVPVTDLCFYYEVMKTDDALQQLLGPKVSEEEALKMAFSGPYSVLDNEERL